MVAPLKGCATYQYQLPIDGRLVGRIGSYQYLPIVYLIEKG